MAYTEKNENLMQIGAVAKKANVNIQTIRYYERRGILKPIERRESGYRLYTEDAVSTIVFIKHAQDLGFALDEIKDLLKLRAPSTNRCERVREKAKQKLSDVHEKIDLLMKMEEVLKKLILDCEANKTTKDCPIIRSMEMSK